MSLVKMVVLARLLVPEDFGLFGIAMLALAAMETFTQTGFDQALIQRRGDIEGHLDTAWTVQLIRGIVLAAALFAAAPLVAWFFGEPRAIDILRVLCLVKVIGAFRNIGIIYFQKDLEFHKQVAYEVTGNAIGLAVGIVLAYQLRNVWALVWASVAAGVMNTVLSYVFHPHRPRLRWDAGQARQLFGYGVWLLGSSIMIYLGSQLDNLMVGKLLGATALGFYIMAYRLSLLPLRETTYAISRILMPAYAKMQGDNPRLTKAYGRVLGLTAMFSIPACLGLILLARPAVQTVLGDQWLPMVLPIQILMGAQIVKSIISTGSPLFLGAGKPKYEFLAQLARTIALAVSIYPLILLYGLEGAAASVIISALAMFALYIIGIKSLCGRAGRILVNSLAPSALAGIVMVLALFYPARVLSDYAGPEWGRVAFLACAVVGGALVYFTASFLVVKLIPGASTKKDILRFISLGVQIISSTWRRVVCHPKVID